MVQKAFPRDLKSVTLGLQALPLYLVFAIPRLPASQSMTISLSTNPIPLPRRRPRRWRSTVPASEMALHAP
jgi:hypothetical protein